MPQTVWKVVNAILIDDMECYYSSLLGILDSLIVEYRPGQKAFPPHPGSYLYAFDNEKAAREFIVGAGEILKPCIQPQVWKAEAAVVPVIKPTCAIYRHEDFWDQHLYALPYENHVVVPCAAHTIWCEWITLVECIQGRHPDPMPQDRKKVSPTLTWLK